MRLQDGLLLQIVNLIESWVHLSVALGARSLLGVLLGGGLGTFSALLGLARRSLHVIFWNSVWMKYKCFYTFYYFTTK